MSDPDNLTNEDATILRTIRKRSKDLNRLAHHVEEFAVILTRELAAGLGAFNDLLGLGELFAVLVEEFGRGDEHRAGHTGVLPEISALRRSLRPMRSPSATVGGGCTDVY